MIHDLYSKRRKIERGEFSDIYQYDVLPNKLKMQILYLFENTSNYNKKEVFDSICKILREERGVFQLSSVSSVKSYFGSSEWDRLGGEFTITCEKEVKTYFLEEEDADHALDVVELFFRLCGNSSDRKILIEKLNIRFREHGVGYAYEANKIIRVDNQLTHAEIVKPALKLIHTQEFSNVEDEYLKAHEHYRHGRHAEALVECLKALETTMKIIADKHMWQFDPKDSASRLISIMFDNNLIPSYLQTHFKALKSCLESCVPTVRNRIRGHGQGIVKTDVPDYLAGYIINSTAVNILLLVEAEKALR